jgi:hypothetical protein
MRSANTSSRPAPPAPATTECALQLSSPLVGSSHSSTAGRLIMLTPTLVRLASPGAGVGCQPVGWAHNT